MTVAELQRQRGFCSEEEEEKRYFEYFWQEKNGDFLIFILSATVSTNTPCWQTFVITKRVGRSLLCKSHLWK